MALTVGEVIAPLENKLEDSDSLVALLPLGSQSGTSSQFFVRKDGKTYDAR